MARIKGVIGNFSDVIESERKEKGCATLKHLKLSESDARMSNLRAFINGESGFMRIESGDYIQLYVHGELMMSDTPMERRTNDEFIANAHGKVMIAGLGVGMILEALIPLCESGVVTSVVVYEKYQDVIDLVGHRYINRMPLEIRLATLWNTCHLKMKCTTLSILTFGRLYPRITLMIFASYTIDGNTEKTLAAGWTVGWRIFLDVEGITKSAVAAVVGGNHKLK